MIGFTTWVVDNIVGSAESIILNERDSLKIRATRALETISNDITPQESIREIFRRFPEVLTQNNVRQKLYERMRRYCYDETEENADARAQEMFEDILCKSSGVIPVLSELLWKTNTLLFFRNNELYNRFNDDLGLMYEVLTDEQKVEFAPKVLRTRGYLLREIPKNLRSKIICDIAVKQSGTALKHVPLKWKTKKLMKIAVNQSGYALEYVKKKYQREMTCLAYQKGGQDILKQPWFVVLFKKLTQKQQQTCIDKEKHDRDDVCNRWHNARA